jgi:hypothetical protein
VRENLKRLDIAGDHAGEAAAGHAGAGRRYGRLCVGAYPKAQRYSLYGRVRNRRRRSAARRQSGQGGYGARVHRCSSQYGAGIGGES